MNYQAIYDRLIDRAICQDRTKGDGTYYEKHHIVPRCLGGTNDVLNLVLLTAKEHYLAHHLLTKIYPNNPKISYAYIMMCKMDNSFQDRFVPSARAYKEAKELHSLHHIPTGGRHKKVIYDSLSGKYYLGIRHVRKWVSGSYMKEFLKSGRLSYVDYSSDMVFSSDPIHIPSKKLLDKQTGILYGVREWRAIKGNYYYNLQIKLASGELEYVKA
jgi:hypothetical protein